MGSSQPTLDLRLAEKVDRLCDRFEEAFFADRRPRIEAYLRKAPKDAREVLLLELIRTEVELRHRSGDSPEADEYIARFPSHRQLIGSMFRGSSQFDRAGSTQDDDGDFEIAAEPERIGRFAIGGVLGVGGFGIVYRAKDLRLERTVAVKVPRERVGIGRQQIEEFLREARSAARLHHPNLVSVHEAFVHESYPVIVYEYVEANDLASLLDAQRLPLQNAMDLFERIVAGMAHAHRRGVVHCDLKLANVLIDDEGQPRVTDFGLARVDQTLSKSAAERFGTPAAMAPEQVRGERDLIDERTDVWSLGVILFRLLSGQPPFDGDSRGRVFQQILNYDPGEALERDPSIPAEIANVCLRCLSKRREDRHPTAAALLRDIEAVRSQVRDEQDDPLNPSVASIHPRGLRCYTEHDSEFFHRLLPGGADESGLPQFAAAWKRAVESQDPSDTCPVGLIYGPSGSGKSSAVRACLLPALDRSRVEPVYVSASRDRTEETLSAVLCRRFPELSRCDGFAEQLAELRSSIDGRKVTLVVDQFEQWLSSAETISELSLIKTLQQCDGQHLQAILIVRDDFFASINQLFQELGFPLSEGKNYFFFPRFTQQHAARILTLLGQGLGRLPARPTAENEAFVRECIHAVSQQGRVTAVRIAILAEMLRSREWKPGAIAAGGGIDALGQDFLADRLSQKPLFPGMQEAVVRLLMAMLPESDDEIRGSGKPLSLLRDVAGCPAESDFQRLVQHLDGELRLIEPVDVSGALLPKQEQDDDDSVGPEILYQLSHDFLVPSIRQWTHQCLIASRHGRAELKLNEFSELWTQRRDARFLPTNMDWLTILTWTDRRRWTAAERLLMRHAARKHLFRWGVALIVGVALWAFAARSLKRREITQLAERVMDADFANLSRLNTEVREKRASVMPVFEELIETLTPGSDERLKLGLVVLPQNPKHTSWIQEAILSAPPTQIPSILPFLEPVREELTQNLWAVATSEETKTTRFLTATALLAGLQQDGTGRWNRVSARIVDELIALDSMGAPDWIRLHDPVRRHLVRHFESLWRVADEELSDAEATFANDVLALYARDEPETLTRLLLDASPEHFPALYARFSGHDGAINRVRNALAKSPKWKWPDEALAVSTAGPEVVEELAKTAGMITPHFAICQTATRSQFESLSKLLGEENYQPAQVRPYPTKAGARVAAIWLRARGVRKIEWCDEAGAANQILEAKASEGWQVASVAGYLAEGSERFCIVWEQRQQPLVRQRVFVALPEADHWDRHQQLNATGFSTVEQLQAYLGSDGQRKYCGIHSASSRSTAVTIAASPSELDAVVDRDRIEVDVSLVPVEKPEDGTSYWHRVRSDWKPEENTADDNDGLWYLWKRGQADFHLGRDEAALRWLDRLIQERPQAVDAYALRGLIHAHAGRVDQARRDLTLFRLTSFDRLSVSSVASIIRAYLGQDLEEPLEIDASIAAKSRDTERLYTAAATYARCARAARRHSQLASTHYGERALELLRQAVAAGFSDRLRLKRDLRFDGLRDSSAYRDCLAALRSGFACTSVRSTSQLFDDRVASSLSVQEHLTRCRKLAASGFRPVAISAAAVTGQPRVASVWHRPRVTVQAKIRHENRCANAAIAGYLLGDHDLLWPLLKASPEPGLRTKLIHWLATLDCPPEPLLKQLRRTQDPSVRSALLLALGEYPAERVRSPTLESHVVGLYRDDGNPGVHGAAQWLLDRWNLRERAERAVEDLCVGHCVGGRQWYKTKTNGHTMVVIQGPQTFDAGSTRGRLSPVDISSESRRRIRIQRNFAISTCEVTAEQFQRFLHEMTILRPLREEVSWDPRCGVGGVTWINAVFYCRWLSRKEGIPPSELAHGESIESYFGKIVPESNYLDLTGYRLPTAEEWELACRLGTVTNRFFGDDDEDLDNYVWYAGNANFRSWPVGLLKPNQLGLFDILGNVGEWTDKPQVANGRFGSFRFQLGDTRPLDRTKNRGTIGSAFVATPDNLRSANTGGHPPDASTPLIGFRVARTISPADLEEIKRRASDGE